MTASTNNGDASSPATPDAVALMRADHRDVKTLFASFDRADGAAQGRIAAEICAALTVHAQIEEEVFYPAARAALGAKGADMLDQALVEHGSARDLIAKIAASGPGRPLFRAWVRVLGEYIGHHVEEEESELFPKLRSSGMDLHEVAGRLAARKAELIEALARDTAQPKGADLAAGPAGARSSRPKHDGIGHPEHP